MRSMDKKTGLLGAILLAGLTASLSAASIDQLKADSATGDVGAQIELADKYLRGQDVPRDLDAGAKLLKAAATSGDSVAQYRLASLYRRGWGVPQDDKIAFRWYLKSAQQDNPSACHALGLAYLEGAGVRQDFRRSVFWFEKAVKMDVVAARTFLASLYLDAPGVSRNYKRVGELLRPLSRDGDAYALAKMGLLYEEGLGIEKNLSMAVLAYRKAVNVKLPGEVQNLEEKQQVMLARKAQTEAAARLGSLYLKGLGVETDFERAARYFRMAAKGGDMAAYIHLGRMHLIGRGVDLDQGLAISCFNRAAANGIAEAHHELGLVFLGKSGYPADMPRAYIHLSVARALGQRVKAEDLTLATRNLKPPHRIALNKHIQETVATFSE